MRLLAILTICVALSGCGDTGGGGGPAGSSGSSGSSGAGSSASERIDLMLDFFPNADHAGIYAAEAGGHFRDQGLDVNIRTPSDPSVPLKLLAAGKADLAVSYEPEVLRARDKGLPVVAVAALVRVPLTSIVSLPKAGIRTPADLRGKTVGTAGIDYQSAYLDAVLDKAGVPRSSVRERNVGFELSAALLSGKVDAVLGAFWNYEGVQLAQKGKDPQVIRMEQAGVPTYDELVLAASEETVRDHPERIKRFLAALAKGTADLKTHPGRAGGALLAANRDLDPKLQGAAIRVTLPYFLPEAGKPYGYMDPGEWRSFTTFMHSNGLLKLATPEGAFTNELLPAAGG
ncbi:MAG: putative hydroxymethylpyrimidine transport system substrate-binding protein [Thermoleophilaceae bacterium]|nr:putative hydroxymethylpyrimidine transport system substrate-binding protein [Thermoleophilaceae bacterium]